MKKDLLSLGLSAGLGITLLLSPNLAFTKEHGDHQHSLSQEDKATLVDAQIAAIKVGLKLTPAQEKNWPAVETAIRDYDKAKQFHGEAWRKAGDEEHQNTDLVEHLRKKAQFLSAYATETNKLADAVKPLYDSLDEAQKHRLGILLHITRHDRGRHQGSGNHAEGHSNEVKSDDDHEGK